MILPKYTGIITLLESISNENDYEKPMKIFIDVHDHNNTMENQEIFMAHK